MTVLIFGFTTKPRHDAAQFEPVFKAPSNYGEKAAAEHVEKERKKFLDEGAKENPFAGELGSLYLIQPGQPGVELNSTAAAVDWFKTHLAPARLCGFFPEQLVAFLRLGAAELGRPIPLSVTVDPRAIVEGRAPIAGPLDRRGIPLEELLCPSGLMSFDKWYRTGLRRLLKDSVTLPALELGRSSRLDAAIAAALALQFDLWPEFRHQLLTAIMEATSPPTMPNAAGGKKGKLLQK